MANPNPTHNHVELFERLQTEMCCMNENLINELEETFIELAAIKQAAQEFICYGLITNTTLQIMRQQSKNSAPTINRFIEREYLAYKNLQELALD